MVAYVQRMPSGIPGDITRRENTKVEPAAGNPAKPFAFYGVCVKYVAGRAEPLESADAAAVVVGFLVRPYPTGAAASNAGLGNAGNVPDPTQLKDVMRSGYCNVFLQAGTAALRGAVFVRVTAGSGRLVGAIEAAADSGNCVQVVGAYFRGPADAQGNVEIEYNL